MAVWYCGSVQYAAVTQFATSHAYSVGDIVRQLATPAVGSERCFRCTTAGTSGGSEPAWSTSKGATTSTGTAVFTEVTGNATYNWAAPAARLQHLLNNGNWLAADDILAVAHNHAETQSVAMTIGGNFNASFSNPLKILCVNASGSVPPVSADLRATATVTLTAPTPSLFDHPYVLLRLHLRRGERVFFVVQYLERLGRPSHLREVRDAASFDRLRVQLRAHQLEYVQSGGPDQHHLPVRECWQRHRGKHGAIGVARHAQRSPGRDNPHLAHLIRHRRAGASFRMSTCRPWDLERRLCTARTPARATSP